MKIVAALLLVSLAVAHGQFFCPDSADQMTCLENSPNLATCMRHAVNGDYKTVCGYCGKKAESCFGDRVQSTPNHCGGQGAMNAACA